MKAMPLYHYQCCECKYEFEQLMMSRQTDQEVLCPRCEASTVERLLSVPAATTKSLETEDFGGCGVGTPCGLPQCGRLRG
jgi:putative FmdB family regulatory protein